MSRRDIVESQCSKHRHGDASRQSVCARAHIERCPCKALEISRRERAYSSFRVSSWCVVRRHSYATSFKACRIKIVIQSVARGVTRAPSLTGQCGLPPPDTSTALSDSELSLRTRSCQLARVARAGSLRRESCPAAGSRVLPVSLASSFREIMEHISSLTTRSEFVSALKMKIVNFDAPSSVDCKHYQDGLRAACVR